jgi:hypothetical protein
MFRFADWPASHVVPAATDWTTDHVPLAHCWKEVPPMQLNMPSLVHAPVRAPELEEEELDVPVPVPAAAAVAEETGAEATGAGADAAIVVSTEALGAVWDTTVANTPPARSADVVAVDASEGDEVT